MVDGGVPLGTGRWGRGWMRPVLGGVGGLERGEYAVCLEGGEDVGVERGGEDSGVDEGRMPIVVGHVKRQVQHCGSGHRLPGPTHGTPVTCYYLLFLEYYVRQQTCWASSISDPLSVIVIVVTRTSHTAALAALSRPHSLQPSH